MFHITPLGKKMILINEGTKSHRINIITIIIIIKVLKGTKKCDE